MGEIITMKELVNLAVPGNSKNDGDPEAKRFILFQILDALGMSTNDITSLAHNNKEYEKSGFLSSQIKDSQLIDGTDIIHVAQQIERGLKNWVKQADNELRCRKLAKTLRENGFTVISDYIDQCVTNNCSDTDNETIDIEEPCSSHRLISENKLCEKDCGEKRIKIPSYQKVHNYFISKLGIGSSFSSFLCFILFCYSVGFGSASAVFLISGAANFSQEIDIQSALPTTDLLEWSFTTNLPKIAEETTALSTALSTTLTKKFSKNECSALKILPNFQSLERIHLQLIAPDWSKPMLDFCGKGKILLLIEGKNNYPFPQVKCPENVVAVEIMDAIEQSRIKKFLSIFCRLEKLSFVGQDACLTEAIENVPIKSQLLRELEFEDIGQCGKPIMKYIEQTIDVTNVQKIGLKCFQFYPEISNELNNFIAAFPNISTVECINNNNCMGLTIKLKKGIRYRTGFRAC